MIINVYKSAKGNYVAIAFNGNRIKSQMVGGFVACERTLAPLRSKIENYVESSGAKDFDLVSHPKEELGEKPATLELRAILGCSDILRCKVRGSAA